MTVNLYSLRKGGRPMDTGVAVAVVALVGFCAPAHAICTSVQAAVIADDDRQADCDAILATGPCAGVSANACVDDLYDNPATQGPGSGFLEVAFLPKCVDGTDTCPSEEQVKCIDGTRPAAYWAEGSSNRWMIFLGGSGGPCSAGAAPGDCFHKLKNGGPDGKSLTSLDATDRSSKGGMFLWDDYNRIVFEKCHMGEAHRGDAIDSATGDSGNRYTYIEHHHGRLIWDALFGFLKETNPTNLPDLDDASQVVLAGHSDGAKGLIYTGDSLRQTLRSVTSNPTLDVRLALDGHFLPFIEAEYAVGNGNPGCWDRNGNSEADVYDACELPGTLPPDGPPSGDTYSDGVYRPGGRIFDNNEGHGSQIDASCVTAHTLIFADGFESGDISAWTGPNPNATSRYGCQSEMHVLLNHTRVPLFIRMDLWDTAWISTPPQHADDPSYLLPVAEFESRVRQIGQDLIDHQSMESEEPPAAAFAMFVPRTGGPGSHSGLTDTTVFTTDELRECVGGQGIDTWSTGALLGAWLADDPTNPTADYQALHLKVVEGSSDTWVAVSETCP
jgi:hypothetical protein